MQFFKEFLNSAAKIASYGDGLIMLKTKIGLNIVDIDEVGYDAYPLDKVRKDVLNENGPEGKKTTTIEKLDKLAGERFTERNHTKVKAEGTIYGKEQLIMCDERKHSYYGMNRRYLTTDGLPNEAAVMKRLRETNLSAEVKEARVNRLYNSLFAHDFYDNATTLLYVLYTRIYLYRFWKDTNRYNDEFTFMEEQVKYIISVMDEDAAILRLKEIVEADRNGFGISKDDYDLSQVITDMRHWHKEISTTKQGEALFSSKFTWEVKVWKMYSYDDGHSKSGKNFGNVVGFVNNKFKVCLSLFTALVAEPQMFVASSYLNLGTDNAVDSYGKANYFLNVTNLNPAELTVLSSLVRGVKRITPFLVDQTIELVGDLKRINTQGPVRYSDCDIEYDDKMLMSILNKVVTKHRLHEDFMCAVQAARFWLAQPSTETVEAHWWLAQSRRLHLPQLGLKRAAFTFLLHDEGVCTTQAAIDTVSNISVRDDSAVVESLCMNAYWYWGELFARYNKETQMQLECSVESKQPLDIDDERRAEVMVSAITGRKVSIPVHNLIRTEWDIQLEDNYKIIVPFGKIQFEHKEDYGYKLRDDNNYILNCLPTPGAAAIVIGLSGSLIAGTPMSSLFCSANAAFIKEGKMKSQAVMFNDLWAYGTYLRWQGHDLRYKYPMTQNRHVVFAANNVGIAMPPVLPPKTRTLSYVIEAVERREYNWVSDIDFILRCNTTYRWAKSPLVVQQKPDWAAPASVNLLVDSAVITKFKGYVDDTNNYVVALEGKYGIRSSGFHMAYVTPAVPLGPNVGELGSVERQEEERTNIDLPQESPT